MEVERKIFENAKNFIRLKIIDGQKKKSIREKKTHPK